VPKVEHLVYGDRKVFTVSAFNRGIGMVLGRLPAVWVEGEVTELRRNDAWANVFVTLKDPKTGATLSVTIARRTYDRLELGLEEGFGQRRAIDGDKGPVAAPAMGMNVARQ
jgi:exonuclease VII large subunit